jgi:type I restriction enzyme R subunit
MNGSRIDKAKFLRDKYLLVRDNEDEVYIDFFKFSGVSDSEEWCKNIFEVANQIEVEGKYKNRYDVTILINGLPLVQIELKRNGVELKEAFNQVKRYHLESYSETLFEYIQMFIISNKIHTRYFANNPKLSFDFTFRWSDENNNPYNNIFQFSDNFLKPCFLAKIIGEYVVISESKKEMFILRPYQYFAVEKIIKQVKLFKEQKGGYIWHTTGSGKTLTSFKASQIISRMPEIDKVMFVVDRKDLDIQTIKEFKAYDSAIEGTENTNTLIKQLKSDKKLIVTTIQKLSIAIQKDKLKEIQDKKIVIIFDECHRNQFGKTSKEIKKFFKNSIMFGFTGTPIFEENQVNNSTTADVFGNALHKYVITDAIADRNVLGFMIEYFETTKTENIKEEELLDEDRTSKIVDKIIEIHDKKTKHRQFNALFATASKDLAMMYYNAFKNKKHDLKIGIVFTYAANEDIDIDVYSIKEVDERSKDLLENAIADYNKMFKTNFSGADFYRYYADLQKRIKNNELDIVLVVGMLLTGFDHKRLNTLYVDKNLKYHGLIQAFSRTNRILNNNKPYGNIVSFRDLKDRVDEALELFGNKEKNDIVLKKEYSEIKKDFIEKLEAFKNEFKTPEVASNLKSEEKKIEFVKAFRELLKLKSSLETYVEFSFEDVGLNEEEWFDYMGVYVDVYNESKTKDEEAPIREIDFSIELIRSDLINYDYIINLLTSLKENNETLFESDEYIKKKEELLKQFDRDLKIRDKKYLIEDFIENRLKHTKKENIKEEFDKFWDEKKEEELQNLANKIDADYEKLKDILKEYEFSSKFPKNDDIKNSLNYRLPLKGRSKKLSDIKLKLLKFIDLFEW